MAEYGIYVNQQQITELTLRGKARYVGSIYFDNTLLNIRNFPINGEYREVLPFFITGSDYLLIHQGMSVLGYSALISRVRDQTKLWYKIEGNVFRISKNKISDKYIVTTYYQVMDYLMTTISAKVIEYD